MIERDLDAVAAIFSHYVTTGVATFETVPPTVDDWRRKLADVADEGTELLGFAYASPWRPKPAYGHTVEDTIYLAPGHTGRGIGVGLLGELLSRCADAKMRQVIAVIADTGSDASAALHRKFGFAQVGRLTGVGHKHDRWIDTILMQLDLATLPPRDQGVPHVALTT
jgi:L-amino acid N-acyltransferase YncA